MRKQYVRELENLEEMAGWCIAADSALQLALDITEHALCSGKPIEGGNLRQLWAALQKVGGDSRQLHARIVRLRRDGTAVEAPLSRDDLAVVS